MAQEEEQPKFEGNPCIRFRDNCDADGRRMTDKTHIPWPLLTQSSRAKDRKLKISKILKVVLWGSLGGKFMTNSKLWPAICRSSVLKFSLPLGPMLTNKKKKSLKFQFSKFQKAQTYLCEDSWEENSGKVWKLSAAICRSSSVLKFSLP